MNLRIFSIFAILLFWVNNIFGLDIISNHRVTLTQLIKDPSINLDQGVAIYDSNRAKTIKKHDNFSWNFEKTGICVQAFVKWCNHFVGAKRKYTVFRIPPDLGLGDEAVKADCDTISSQLNNIREIVDSGRFDIGKSRILVDPFYFEVPLNEFIDKEEIIVATCIKFDESVETVEIGAIIPFEGKFYRFYNYYIFSLIADGEESGTKDVSVIPKIFSHPNNLIADNVGTLIPDFFYFYFRHKFKNMGPNVVKQIYLDKKNSVITLKSLFDQGIPIK